MQNIYFDNAATSYPKAPNVSQAVCNYIDKIGVNALRGTYQSSYSAGKTIFETRELLCDLFNYHNPLNAVFTYNITHSINIILKGLIKPGDHIIVSSMEHNAVMRPLFSLIAQGGVEFDRIKCDITGEMDPADLKKLIKKNTRLVLLTHASNVCGTIFPIEEIGEICKAENVPFVIDSAQSAGVLKVDFKRFNLSGLAFTGHKGLLGPQGVGGIILDDYLSTKISPFIEGGTGSQSEYEYQPDFMPDKFESGTLNLPGIFGLNASLKYIKEIGISTIYKKEMELTKYFLEKIVSIPGIDIIGKRNVSQRTSVVSLNFKNNDNSEIAYKLDSEYGIMTRVGLHCAPNAHKTLNTYPTGTLRFSFGYTNTLDEINYTLEALKKILITP
jgi:cysteine desulfurase family protein